MAAGSRQAADDLGRTIRIDACPVADGGDGTLEALVLGLGAEVRRCTVAGPLGESLEAAWGIAQRGELAIIELALASGLARLRADQRDVLRASTYGTGQLIAAAAAAGCGTILLGLGGSATVDGGTGLAQALGGRFFDSAGTLITDRMCGGLLERIGRFVPPRGPLPRLRACCDVTNPLCGPDGAAAVYGPQKGATPEQVRRLDAGLANLARVLGIDSTFPGAGAAGGAGYGLVAMLSAALERGADLVLEMLKFRDRCAGAALVLTGEGRLDGQTLHGKAVLGVSRAAAACSTPAIAIVGSTGPGWEACLSPAAPDGLRAVIDLAAQFGSQRALSEPAALVQAAARAVIDEAMRTQAR